MYRCLLQRTRILILQPAIRIVILWEDLAGSKWFFRTGPPPDQPLLRQYAQVPLFFDLFIYFACNVECAHLFQRRASTTDGEQSVTNILDYSGDAVFEWYLILETVVEDLEFEFEASELRVQDYQGLVLETSQLEPDNCFCDLRFRCRR